MDVNHLKHLQFQGKSVVVCTDISEKEPHRQVGVDRMMTSGSIGGEMGSTIAWNAGYVGSIASLGSICPMFITRSTPPFPAIGIQFRTHYRQWRNLPLSPTLYISTPCDNVREILAQGSQFVGI